MAKVLNNALLKGLSGQLGKVFIIRTVGNKTIISSYPRSVDKSKETIAQKATRSKFKTASSRAKKAMKDPALKAQYQKIAKRRKLPNAYTAAVSEFMKKT